MKGDLQVIGDQSTRIVNVAASATRFEVGEPLISGATFTSGAASANVYALAAADFPVIGTDLFGGIAIKAARPWKTGTLIAQKVPVVRPLANAGFLRGRAETAGNIDTAAELLAIMEDVTLIDYDATGASDGGELYTIKDTASADTSGLKVVGGNIVTGQLDVTVDPGVYRHDVS